MRFISLIILKLFNKRFKGRGVITMKNKVLLPTLIIFVIISGMLIYINWLLKPLPREKRNTSTSDVKMVVRLEDVDNRIPIVLTYTREEFDDFDETKINEIKEKVNGNIEGDIPALVLQGGTGEIKFQFEENSASVKTNPKSIPEIKISASPISDQKNSKEFRGLLIKNGNMYSYKLKRYFPELIDRENSLYENDKFFMESVYVEINYEIDGKEYVSIFAINTMEYK